MHFFSPRAYTLIDSPRRMQLAAYLNLVASQSHGKASTFAGQAWFADRLGVVVRTVKRYEAECRKLGLLIVDRQWRRRAVSLSRVLLDLLPARLGGHRRHAEEASRVPSSRRRIDGSRARSDQGTLYKAGADRAVNGVAPPSPAGQTEPRRPEANFAPVGFGAAVHRWISRGRVGKAPSVGDDGTIVEAVPVTC